MRLECRHLNFTYPGSKMILLQDINVSIEGPGFNALFGPSGIGKTSFAKLLAGLDYYDMLKGKIITRHIDKILYSYNMERLPGWSNIGSHLTKVCPIGQKTLKEELIRIFRLERVVKSRFAQLSMGQQNRINLIRYLLQDFDLLILDESLANVDEKLREIIILSIKKLFPDRMFLYISHNLMEVARFCKDIMVLKDSSSDRRNVSIVKGKDCRTGYPFEKKELDTVILEIMNAF